MTASTNIYYRTMTNLIHPAVLGTIIVNLIQAILYGTLFHSGVFPVIASAILVWYFILDYWVITTNFENTPTEYSSAYFLIDIITLIVLFGSFYSLWSLKSDFWFFLSIILLITLILIWSILVIGSFTFKDPIDKIQIVVLVLGIIPFLSSVWKPYSLLHFGLKYISLIGIIIALVFYTVITLRE